MPSICVAIAGALSAASTIAVPVGDAPPTPREVFEAKAAGQLAEVDAPPPVWPSVSDQFVQTTPYHELLTWMERTRMVAREPRNQVYVAELLEERERAFEAAGRDAEPGGCFVIHHPRFNYLAVGVLPDRQWRLLFDRVAEDLVGVDTDTRSAARQMVDRLALTELNGPRSSTRAERRVEPCPFPASRDRIGRILFDQAFGGPLSESAANTALAQQLLGYDVAHTKDAIVLLTRALAIDSVDRLRSPGAILANIAYSSGLEGLDSFVLDQIE